MGTKNDDSTDWAPRWTDYAVSVVGGLCFLGQVILCVTAYNRLGLERVLYLGWTLLAAALALGITARGTLEEGDGKPAQPVWRRSKAFVEIGVYGMVRHPIYLSFSLVLASMVLISQHWLSALLGLPWIGYLYLSMVAEDRARLVQFGDAYRRYIQVVPRLNLPLGALRYWRRSRRKT
jgi:protein-S-isoprenylcysteine O-methyltransferase Ste14